MNPLTKTITATTGDLTRRLALTKALTPFIPVLTDRALTEFRFHAPLDFRGITPDHLQLDHLHFIVSHDALGHSIPGHFTRVTAHLDMSALIPTNADKYSTEARRNSREYFRHFTGAFCDPLVHDDIELMGRNYTRRVRIDLSDMTHRPTPVPEKSYVARDTDLTLTVEVNPGVLEPWRISLRCFAESRMSDEDEQTLRQIGKIVDQTTVYTTNLC